MKTISKQHGLGNIVALFLIPSVMVDSIIDRNIFYQGADPSYKLEFATESVQFSSKYEDSRAGSLYNHSIKGFIPGNSDNSREMLINLCRYPALTVVFQTNETTFYCIGNSTEGLRFYIDFSAPSNPSENPSFAFELSGKLTIPVKLINWPALQL
jgi:hypothetical protein